MTFTLYGAALILVFALLGYFRGALRIVAAVLSLAAAAPLAMALAPHFTELAASLPHVPKALAPFAAILLAGIIFFIALILIAEILLRVRKRRREERNLPPMEPWERWGGAILGASWGLFLVVLIFVGIDIIGSFESAMTGITTDPKKTAAKPGEFTALKEEVETSIFAPLVQKANPVDEKVARTFQNLTTVISDPALFEKFTNHPTVAKLARHPRLIAVAQDPEIQQLIQQNDFYGLLDNPKIAELLQDKELFLQLKDVDMEAILTEILGAEAVR